jgi:hypothetical protein
MNAREVAVRLPGLPVVANLVDDLLALVEPLLASRIGRVAPRVAGVVAILQAGLPVELLLLLLLRDLDLPLGTLGTGSRLPLGIVVRPLLAGLLPCLLALFAGLGSLLALLLAVGVVIGLRKRRARRGACQQNGYQELTHDSDLSSSLPGQMRFLG